MESGSEATVFLVGDAGRPANHGDEPVLSALAHDASGATGQTFVIYLGDNIYPAGLPENEPKDGENAQKLAAQVDCFKGNKRVHVRFIPGNHDYKSGEYASVERERALIEARGAALGIDAHMYPLDRQPFTDKAEQIGASCNIVYIDTHRYLQDIQNSLTDEERLKETMAQATVGDTPVIVVGHYPLASHGRHGGFYSWQEHLFPFHELSTAGYLLPLPLIGSLYPLVRGSGVFDIEEDMASASNLRFVESMEHVFASNRPIVYASGHEHALQLLREPGSPWLIVSGAGYLGRQESITTGQDTAFASPEAGYFRLDFFADRRVLLEAVEVRKGECPVRVFATWLGKD